VIIYAYFVFIILNAIVKIKAVCLEEWFLCDNSFLRHWGMACSKFKLSPALGVQDGLLLAKFGYH